MCKLRSWVTWEKWQHISFVSSPCDVSESLYCNMSLLVLGSSTEWPLCSVLAIGNGVGYYFPPWVMWPFWVFSPSFFCFWASSHPTVRLWASLPFPVVSLPTLLRAGYDPPLAFIKRKCGLSVSSSNGNSLACSSPGHPCQSHREHGLKACSCCPHPKDAP